MSFPMVVSIATEALFLVIICATVLGGMHRDIKEERKNNPKFKPSFSDWTAFVIIVLWMGFQFWKAWCVIRTLL